ncbi:MAG: twin-arginine translocase subunit TatC [Tannerellaceae bacterium]|jgi:sec-independent protein translocase protein TatC|nr:twin-arginine translocase subunit TatC [Tannerellaceae bacterium]
MQQDEMSFWDHLEDLRWTILRSLAALLLFMIALFAFMRGEHGLFDTVILAPVRGDFITYQWFCKAAALFGVDSDFCNLDFRIDIFNIRLASQFFTHMTTSFWLAIVLTFPYLIYEVWKFISPALYDNEKKSVSMVFVFGTAMFFVGCALGYFMVFPVTLRFLATYQISEAIAEQVSLDSYMDNFLMLIFIMGVMFEMPLLSWLLSKLGLINRSLFQKYRRHAVVVLLILAAVITPSGDPFTLMIVFIPLYLLYELSAFFVKPAPPEEDDDEMLPATT